MLLDVGFNREVAEDTALYWTKEEGNLAELINQVENLNDGAVIEMGVASTKRIQEEYSWKIISRRYARFFLNEEECRDTDA